MRARLTADRTARRLRADWLLAGLILLAACHGPAAAPGTSGDALSSLAQPAPESAPKAPLETSKDIAQPGPGDEKAPSPDAARAAALAELAASIDAASANALAQSLLAGFQRSSSASVDLLLARAQAAGTEGNDALALALYGEVIELMPDWAEGWNRRAAWQWQMGRIEAAFADARACVRLEPAHFQAWAGIGLMYEELQRPDRAMAAYRKALDIHPFEPASMAGMARLEQQGEDGA